MVAWSQLHRQHRSRSIGFGVLLLSTLLLLRRNLRARKRFGVSKLSEKLAADTKHQLELADRQLYEVKDDGSKVLLVPFRGKVHRVPIPTISPDTFSENAKHFPPLDSSYRPSIDKVFLRQFFAILRICFPSWKSKELWMLALHSFFLVMRTVLSLVVAWLDGRIVRDLVCADGKGFIKGLGFWFLLAIPSTFTNSMIRYLQSKLSLNLRTKLTRYTHDLYLSPAPTFRYLRAAQAGLEGADQYITADIASFCDSLSSLYGNIMKPSLDLFLFTSQLSATLGFRGTMLMFLNYYLTARILRAVTPAFGRLAAVERRLEGEYRARMSRVGREAEEIAFYNGGYREKEILWKAYLRLVKHVNSIYKIRIAYEWTEDFIIKYLWSAAGYCLIAVPVFFTRKHRSTAVQTVTPGAPEEKPRTAVADRTESYIASRRLLLSLADAGSRLLYAYKDVLELAGLTTRIYTLLSTLHTIPSVRSYITTVDEVRLTTSDIVINERLALDETDSARELDTLVRELHFATRQGEHLMITGPNGVGKTAIARVIKGLWEAKGGTVSRPLSAVSDPNGQGGFGIFFVPQRAYHVHGTLLDQIIYPHSYAQHLKSGRTEAELLEILRAAHLNYLPDREGGWFAVKEWRDVLSGGEKQRMALARVFYHRPKFAVLDECTSAVSSDVEGSMYQYAKDQGISLITISIRHSLAKYHTHILTLSGDPPGSWELRQVGSAEERMELDREIETLEAKLKEVDHWKQRVEELNAMLSATIEPQ